MYLLRDFKLWPEFNLKMIFGKIDVGFSSFFLKIVSLIYKQNDIDFPQFYVFFFNILDLLKKLEIIVL